MTVPPLVVVMGVSGTGKSTVGRALAERLQIDYADGDDFHPPENIAAMAGGRPLTDADRADWLADIGRWLAAHDRTGGVVSCSALRRSYRDVLRAAAARAIFLHLVGDRDLIGARMSRRDHFMPPSLLDSQLAILEPLASDERGRVASVTDPPDTIVEEFLDAARRLSWC